MISLNGNYFSLKHTTTNQCWHISYVIFAMIVVSIMQMRTMVMFPMQSRNCLLVLMG